MNSTRKRILTALWVAVGLAGLIAVVFLPGRLDRSGGPAIAHTSAGIEIIDTPASCQSAAHNLSGGNPTITHVTTAGGVPGVGEEVTISIGAASGLNGSDTFTLTFNAEETGPLAFDITSADLDTAIDGLATVTNVNVAARTGAGTDGDPYIWVVTFTDPAGNVIDMTADFTLIVGVTEVTTIVVVDGIAAANEVQTVALSANAGGGTFTLTFSQTNAKTTAAIAFDATAAAVESALEALANITDVTVTGTGTIADPWVVTFVTPGAKDVPPMTSDSSGLIEDCTSPIANADAAPSHFVNFDKSGDGTDDTILVEAGTSVTLVAHVRASDTAKVADGTDVDFSSSALTAKFTSGSSDSAADGQLEGACDGTDTGTLFDGDDDDTITAQVVRDIDAGNDASGSCSAAADTCIDGGGAGEADGTPPGTDDGIVIAVIRSDVGAQTTVTVSSPQGSDTINIIWAGDQAVITVTTIDDEELPDTVLEDVISATGAGGDEDLGVFITVADSDGNPVPGANVQCSLSDDDQATLSDDLFTAGGATGTAEESATTPGLYGLRLDSDAANDKGDITVTCWVDKGGAKDELDTTDETTHSDTATVHIAGEPAAITFEDGDGNAITTLKVNAFDTAKITAVVMDNLGQTVADETQCTWGFADPEQVAVIVIQQSTGADTNETEDGEAGVLLAQAAAGGLVLVAVCGDATGALPIQVNAADLPTPGPSATPGGPTNTPGGPTNTPGGPTATAAPPTATPGPLSGDANGDGTVNSIDAALILQLDAGLIDSLPSQETADVNGDGSIDSIDATLILQLDAGLISSLPG